MHNFENISISVYIYTINVFFNLCKVFNLIKFHFCCFNYYARSGRSEIAEASK